MGSQGKEFCDPEERYINGLDNGEERGYRTKGIGRSTGMSDTQGFSAGGLGFATSVFR